MPDSTTERSLEKSQLIAALEEGEIVRILRGNCSVMVQIEKGDEPKIKEVKIHA